MVIAFLILLLAICSNKELYVSGDRRGDVYQSNQSVLKPSYFESLVRDRRPTSTEGSHLTFQNRLVVVDEVSDHIEKRKLASLAVVTVSNENELRSSIASSEGIDTVIELQNDISVLKLFNVTQRYSLLVFDGNGFSLDGGGETKLFELYFCSNIVFSNISFINAQSDVSH
jgi:hypothetical protein